jgi:hypothetical protein
VDCPVADSFECTVSQQVSAGGMARLLKRDPGLVGGGNGGTGTSVNYDDGNRQYGRGLTSFAAQGRTLIEGRSAASELKLDAVYFLDLRNAEAGRRAGRDLYLNDAYVGSSGVRLGYQILRWSESPSFGHSIAPVNPISASRRYQPGNSAQDAYVALPMLSARIESAGAWSLQGFYQLGFKGSEPEAAGTFLSSNDYYSPGGRYLQLGAGSPAVPDTEASVVTPATPFGSKVSRAPDRQPSWSGQFGMRLETPPFGATRLVLAGYAMRVHAREPIVSVTTGTLGGLQRVTAPDYTSSGNYFVEYVPATTVLGTSARFSPAAFTRVNFDYATRLHQPLQIDDDALITAGLAPAAATAACGANPASAQCAATLAALNRNPVIASRGGITAANAASFFSTELSGYERVKVSQYALSVVQGLPAILAASQWSLAAEAGGLYIHGFKDNLIDASVSIRPDASGARRIGLATRSAWGYRLSSRLDYRDVMGMQSVSPSLTWIHDVKGNAPINLGTLLEDTKSLILAADFSFDRALGGRIAYRSYLGKGSNADRFSDRDFIAFSVTRRF